MCLFLWLWFFSPQGYGQIYFNTFKLSANLLNSLCTVNVTVNPFLGTSSEMGIFPHSPVAKEHHR